MAAMPWGVVIVDESHNLRTTNSRDSDSPHTEACVAAVVRAHRAVLLSGTPSLSRPYDLFRQVRPLAQCAKCTCMMYHRSRKPPGWLCLCRGLYVFAVLSSWWLVQRASTPILLTLSFPYDFWALKALDVNSSLGIC